MVHLSKWKTSNIYRVNGPVAILQITRRNGDKHLIMFDSERFDEVKKKRWRMLNCGHGGQLYVVTGGPSVITFLHRMLDQTPLSMECGFRNNDSHDCRQANLFRGNRHEMTVNQKRRKDKEREVWLILGRETDITPEQFAAMAAAMRKHGMRIRRDKKK